MRLKTAVTSIALLLAAVFATLCMALINTTDLLDRQSRELVRAGESIRVSQSLRNRLLAHNRNSFLYQLTDDLSRFESRQTQRGEIEALVREAETFINTEEERAVVAEVRQAMEAYLARLDELEEQTASVIDRYALVSNEVDVANAVVERLTAVNRNQTDQLAAAIGERNRDANVVAGVLFGVGTLILCGVAIAVFQFIARPLTRLAGAIGTFSKDGVAARVAPSGLTEIRTLGASFNSLTKRLEEKRKDQLRFIASIAHDLRNPLNSMSITTELLLKQASAESMRMLEVLSRQVKILERLVSDLLDTTHIESGHLELDTKRQDIGPLVRDAVDLHRTAADLHRFKLELADELVCCCDTSRLAQVINNLLSNAVKYSPNGGVITVMAARERDAIVLSVADQGMGIETQDIDDIFKPFNRSSATKGTIPGIGLGLSTSRRIIEAHGGTLTVTSEPGQGAIFRVHLPCIDDPGAESR